VFLKGSKLAVNAYAASGDVPLNASQWEAVFENNGLLSGYSSVPNEFAELPRAPGKGKRFALLTP